MIFTKFVWPPLGEYKREMLKQFETHEQFLQFAKKVWKYGGRCVEYFGPNDTKVRYYKYN